MLRQGLSQSSFVSSVCNIRRQKQLFVVGGCKVDVAELSAGAGEGEEFGSCNQERRDGNENVCRKVDEQHVG
jgi:hypothetical protein